eukprot:229595-Chlamydomonas_euryale.AAC.1
MCSEHAAVRLPAALPRPAAASTCGGRDAPSPSAELPANLPPAAEGSVGTATPERLRLREVRVALRCGRRRAARRRAAAAAVAAA